MRWVATAHGTVWKVVTCSHCQQRYAFQLELETTGTVGGARVLMDDEGARVAQAKAEENLAKMARNLVFPLPCPNCGCYQPEMVDRLREEGTSNAPMIAGILVAMLSLIPLAFSVPYIWVATAIGMSVGLGLIGYADWAAARWDPNAGNPEQRKARGRKRAVWGEELDQLLATDMAADLAPVGGRAEDALYWGLWLRPADPVARAVGRQAAGAELGAAPDTGRI
jgi:hypothetical protein